MIIAIRYTNQPPTSPQPSPNQNQPFQPIPTTKKQRKPPLNRIALAVRTHPPLPIRATRNTHTHT